MPEYYIRTPDRDESRGPFTPEQLLTLVEAEQVTMDTLYYDDPREEWLPIGTNIELREKVFPEREKLTLKINKPEEADEKKAKKKKEKKSDAKEKAKSMVVDMLAVAENDTKSARSKRRRDASFKRATNLINNGLCIILLLSSITLIVPHLNAISEIISVGKIGLLVNYPLILLSIVDFLLAIYVYFGDRKLYPLVRARAMLTLGFGAYIGWAIGDLYILIASVSFGIGVVWTTLVKRFSLSLFTVALGFGGSAFLAYLALTGHFDGFLNSVFFEFFPVE